MTEAERDLLIGPDNAELVKRIEDNLARWVLQGGSTKTETHGLLREAATALSRQQVPEDMLQAALDEKRMREELADLRAKLATVTAERDQTRSEYADLRGLVGSDGA